MLYAIAIYHANGVNKPYLSKVATPKNQSFFSRNNPLDTFDHSTLLKVAEGIAPDTIYHAIVKKEHHYVQHAAHDHIRVIISSTELTTREQDYLFHNSKYVPIDKILQDSAAYVGKDCSPWQTKVDSLQAKLEETKHILLQDIQLVLDRGEKLDDLASRTDDLRSASLGFHDEAKKLNSCCSYW